MPRTVTIRPGDSTNRIASEHGHFANTIWNDAANAELKKKRSDMDILMPGDQVVVPDLRIKNVEKPAGALHRFKRKGVPIRFRLQLFVADRPRANEDYRFDVDGKLLHGKTDKDGMLKEYIPPEAKRGLLVIGPAEARYKIEFGGLNPSSEVTGVQQRLANLGFDCGAPDGKFGERTSASVAEFQRTMGLEVTGKADDVTKAKLKEAHDDAHKGKG